MQRRPPPPPHRAPASSALLEMLKRPQVLLPALVVVGMLAVAFGVQPGGNAPAATGDATIIPTAATSPTSTPTPQPSPTPTRPAVAPSTATVTGDTTLIADPAQAPATAQNDVAGARATATSSATAADPDEPDFSRQSTECGGIQETAIDLAVEQSLNGVSVRATRVAVYPVEYFRCILMATGGREAVALATAVQKAEREGATHAVLADLWITNTSKSMAQLNLKGASLAAAGQTFAPLATLGGRAEVVVSSGQGRTVTLVATVTNGVGGTTGPITLTVDPPFLDGKKIAGKYQLFLPTP